MRGPAPGNAQPSLLKRWLREPRKKAMFKVYVGGLYLESPSRDAGAISRPTRRRRSACISCAI